MVVSFELNLCTKMNSPNRLVLKVLCFLVNIVLKIRKQ